MQALQSTRLRMTEQRLTLLNDRISGTQLIILFQWGILRGLQTEDLKATKDPRTRVQAEDIKAQGKEATRTEVSSPLRVLLQDLGLRQRSPWRLELSQLTQWGESMPFK